MSSACQCAGLWIRQVERMEAAYAGAAMAPPLLDEISTWKANARGGKHHHLCEKWLDHYDLRRKQKRTKRLIVSRKYVAAVPPRPVSTKVRSFVYFIRSGASGPIKIGKAAFPEQRLRELQTGNAERLDLIGYIPGDRRTECALHGRLSKHRVTGEWFRPTDEVLAVISEALDGRQARAFCEGIGVQV